MLITKDAHKEKTSSVLSLFTTLLGRKKERMNERKNSNKNDGDNYNNGDDGVGFDHEEEVEDKVW